MEGHHTACSRITRVARAELGAFAALADRAPAGAATQGRFDGLSDAELKTRGRWASDRSLRIYLDVAMALANRTLQAATRFQYLLVDPSSIGSIFRFS